MCRARGGPKLLDALLASEGSSKLDRTEITQPALFTLQAGLVELWRSWGIEADAVLGHSVGETAAAWASGSYDLDSIFRVIIARSRLQEKMRGMGRMLAAAMTHDDAQEWEQKSGGAISIAAFNSPRQVTLSGDSAALDEIALALAERDVFHRFLNTDYPFHSARMDTIEGELRHELGSIAGRKERVPLISTVTGQPQRGTGMDADYWWRNVRQPVRFGAAIDHLLGRGFNVFVEIGPHPVMASALTESILATQATATIAASLRREQDERATMLRALATLYRSGAQVRWEALYSRPSRRVNLPAYPWQRQRFWSENPEVAGALRRPPSHPLLGDRRPDPQPSWLNHLDARLVPWLAEHRLGGSAVLPAAAYVEMAAAAVRELLGEPTILLEDIRFHRMLILPDEQPVPTSVRLDARTSTFQIFSAPPDDPGAWVLHAEGIFRPGRLHAPPPADLAALSAEFHDTQDPTDLYREAATVGQDFGPAFQGLESLRLREGEALGEVAADADSRDYVLFPPLLDSCFHPWAGVVRGLGLDSQAVVVAIAQVQVFAFLPGKVWSHVRRREADRSQATGDVTIYDQGGLLLARVNGMSVRRIERNRAASERKYFKLAWEPAESLPRQIALIGADDRVLILADRKDAGSALVAALRGRGIAATMALITAASRLWDDFAAAGPLPSRVILMLRDDFGASPSGTCATLLALVQTRMAIEPGGRSARWLVVTQQAQPGEVSPRAAAVWGFVRTLQTEKPDWNVTLVNCAEVAPAEALVDELFATDAEPEVTLRADGRDVRRLRAFQPEAVSGSTPPPAFALEIGQTGRPDSLHFRGRSRPAPGAGEVEVAIAAAGLNFRDLMKVLGIYPLKSGERATLGDEFSGRVARIGTGVKDFAPGDRVMGIAPRGGAFGSHLLIPAEAVWKTPAHLSDAEAASIPVVFGTAHHALHSLARLRAGETVLIHAAAGGVGLAAVHLARQIGAVVFATAGSEEKRDYLRSLGVAHVMDSRTLDFAEETLRQTGGRGVDVVLNSLAGAFQQKSLEVCAPCGRFVEIGKRDLFENRALPLAAFQRSLTFSAFDLGAVISSRGDEWPALRRFFAEAFAPGMLEPIRSTTIPAGDTISAFRLMQGAQHIGKIVVEFGGAPPEVPAEFWPKRDATYLVTGGLSGFGLATARWLAERGAGHLALLSTSGKPSPEDAPFVEDLRAQGVSITMLAADVSDPAALADAMRKLANSAPPLRGVFHAAAVIRDRTLETMTVGDLDAVLAPKIAGAWNLHEQTGELPLDCFVMFSSIASLLGSLGQANYAAANAYLDALAHFRRRAGRPGLTVNWGQIADVGTIARRPELGRYLDSIGVRGMSSNDALARLALLIGGSESQVGVMDVDWDRLGLTSSKFKQSPLIRDLVSAGRADGTRKRVASEWRKGILSLPEGEQLAAVSEMICGQLAATLGLPQGDIDAAKPLVQFGMDSLMGVELKARIESQAGVEMPMNLFSADLTAGLLAERFLAHLRKPTEESDAAPAPAETAPIVESAPDEIEPVLPPRESATLPHWSLASPSRPRGIPHPLQASRPGYVFDCFREYGAPDAGLRFWFRTFNILWASVAWTPFHIAGSWLAKKLAKRSVPLEPVFIIGHWRSGTTHLHRLLSQDPQFGFVTLLQATFPSDFITTFHRLLLAVLLPKRRPMDAIEVAQGFPEEEEMAMASSASCSFFHAFFFPRAGRRIYRRAVHFEGVAPEEVEGWWSTYVAFLKKVQFAQSGRRLLLKNPANTARISELRARFPGAKFIHLHRHPEEVFASTLFLHRKLQSVWALQEGDTAKLRDTVLANYADLMSAYFEQSRGFSERELIEIRLDDLEANPLATIETIYRQLELPGFDAASAHFTSYLERIGTHEKNRLGLTDDERSSVRAALAPVFERWGYRKDPASRG
ncbi:MAG: SDR family NAD(P)-dependent oxidoreductase [Chthoniobacteraceae bacterium]